jgi:hypothetical protein
MHPMINYAARNATLAALSVLLIGLLALLAYTYRRTRKVTPLLIIGFYYVLLTLLSVYGLIRDDGYGWAFLPMVIATMPSYLLTTFLREGALAHWFASGYFGSFVLAFVICGGLNSLGFYLITKFVGQALHPQEKVAQAGSTLHL